MVEPARRTTPGVDFEKWKRAPSLPRTQIIVNRGIAGGRNEGVARA
jgi:hypothetical protein